MPRKGKSRRLWLGIEVVSVPSQTPRALIISVLKESIFRGDFSLPSGWKINIRWRNREGSRMKVGPWTEELTKSAASSPGFNSTVIDYLERQF